MTNERLEKAKIFYNAEIEKAKPTLEHNIWEIKQEILCYILEEVFMDNPTKEEQGWLGAEEKLIEVYLNTESF